MDVPLTRPVEMVDTDDIGARRKLGHRAILALVVGLVGTAAPPVSSAHEGSAVAVIAEVAGPSDVVADPGDAHEDGADEDRAIVAVAEAGDLDAAAAALLDEARRLGAAAPTVIAQDEDRGLLLLEGVDPDVREGLSHHRSAATVVPDVTFAPALSLTTQKIGADKTVAAGQTGLGQTIAVIDTGVAASHPALAGRVVHEVCYVNGGSGCPGGGTYGEGPGAAVPCSLAHCRHGTHVAGIAAGRSVGGQPGGVAPDASVVAIRIFPDSGDAQLWDLLQAMWWVEDHGTSYGVGVVNISLSSGQYAGSCDGHAPFELLRQSVATLRTRRVPVVVATGNEGAVGRIGAPACLSQTVSVSASTLGDARATFANVSSSTSLFAPGVSVYAPVSTGGYAEMSGTSMAAPHVAGAIAVLRQVQTTNLTVPQLVDVLRRTGRGISTPVGTIPRLNLAAAVSAPLAPPSVTATHGSGRATVTWAAASPGVGTAVTGYRITTVPATSTRTVGASTRSTTISGLRNGTRYQIRVQALNGSGAGGSRLSNLVIPKAPPSPHGFPDVGATSYFEHPVRWLKAERITGGVGSSGLYKPNDPVTRAQMAVFLWRLMGSPSGNPAHGFPDVPSASYYDQAVRWLKAKGITGGVGGTGLFKPDDPVTRAQMAAFMHRLVRSPGGYGAHGFVDVPGSSYFEQPVRWLKSTGITTGVGGTSRYEPNQVVNRAQMAAFLHRLAGNPAAWVRVAAAGIPSSIVF